MISLGVQISTVDSLVSPQLRGIKKNEAKLANDAPSWLTLLSINGQPMDEQMDGQMDEWMDGWTDGWTDGRMDGWTDMAFYGDAGCFLEYPQESASRSGAGLMVSAVDFGRLWDLACEFESRPRIPLGWDT